MVLGLSGLGLGCGATDPKYGEVQEHECDLPDAPADKLYLRVAKTEFVDDRYKQYRWSDSEEWTRLPLFNNAPLATCTRKALDLYGSDVFNPSGLICETRFRETTCREVEPIQTRSPTFDVMVARCESTVSRQTPSGNDALDKLNKIVASGRASEFYVACRSVMYEAVRLGCDIEEVEDRWQLLMERVKRDYEGLWEPCFPESRETVSPE